MTFFEDQTIYKTRAQGAIEQYGYAPEHNFDWYICNTEPEQQAVVVEWPDGTQLLTHKEKKEWYLFSEPLVPIQNAGHRIAEFTEVVFESSDIQKVVLELRTQTRKAVLDTLPKTLRASAINYSMTWPVMNMEKFDPILPGGHWKHIRNARNKFYREHRVEIVDAQNVPREELYGLIDRWRKKRNGHDRAYYHHYKNIIDSHFKPTTHAHSMIVDGHVVGLNAGWPIPNTNQYYAAIGIHDYSSPDLGIMLYLADLEFFKKEGMKIVDMAGGEKALTMFKNQFLPESWYKTFVFSIVKR